MNLKLENKLALVSLAPEWFNRIKDLLDQYQPDLFYTDGDIPFDDVGRSLLAHFYNSIEAAHGGKLEAVYNFKNLGTGEFLRETAWKMSSAA